MEKSSSERREKMVVYTCSSSLKHVQMTTKDLVMWVSNEDTCWPMMVMLPGSPLKAEMCLFTH